jgi:hypothetical protein
MRGRYFVRWRAEPDPITGNLQIKGWDVIDNHKFDRATLRSFDVSEKVQAEGLCKLLNSIEEENDGLSK